MAENEHSPKWGGRRQGAGRKPTGDARPGIAAQPRRHEPMISSSAMLEVMERMAERGTRRRRTPEINPFQLPAFPKEALPPKENQMAMDSVPALQWANAAWAGAGGWAEEGLVFLGYPFLAELSQRPEYRVMAETIATEMTRKWIKWSGQAEKKKAKAKGAKDEDAEGEQAVADDKNEKIKELNDYLDHLKCREHYSNLILNDGVFGRSHLYHDFGKEDDDAFDVGNGRDGTTEVKIKKGMLKRLKVVEPMWCYPTNYNAQNPLAENWYNPDMWFVMGRQVHTSRLLPFVQRPVADMLKPAYAFGGLSLTQISKPYVDIWLTTRESVGELIHAFSVMVLKTDLQSIMQPGGVDNIMIRLQMFNQWRDNQGIFAINEATEDFSNVSAPLSGLHELQAQAQEHMFSVTRIPAVKATGIEPTGMNASSEGTLRTFYDTINAGQNHFVRPKLTTTTDFAQISLFGARDPDLVFDFVPLMEETQEEKGKKNKNQAEMDGIYIDKGVLAPEEVRKAISDNPELPYQGIDPDDVPEPPEDPTGDLGDEPEDPDNDNGGGANDAGLPFAVDAAGWNEHEHPRAPDGKFGSGSGGKQQLKAPQLGMPHGHFTASHGGSSSSSSKAPSFKSKQSNIGAPIDTSTMKKVGKQMGSNPGGVYEDDSGKKFYVKQGQSKDHVRNEMIAAALYDLAGTPTLKYRPVEGGGHIATEMSKLDKDNASKLSNEERREASRDFAVHAWLGNWDAIGLGGDNIGTVGGIPTALDLGGAMEYRAQGAPKGKAFGDKVGELDTLRDAKMNKDAAGIFGDMTPADMRESARFVTGLPDSKIRKAVEAQGGSNSLADKLIARKNDIADRARWFGADGDPKKPDSTVVIPAGEAPPVKELNGVKFKAWTPPENWADVDGQASIEEPAFDLPEGKQAASGVIIREPDGRVWMVQPAGGYGGYDGTFPKGRVDEGLSMQANAIKEAYEESGLKVRIVGHAGDADGDVTRTRFYYAEREGGDPSKHDDETEGVVLAPKAKASGFLNRRRDREVLGQDAAFEEGKHPRDSDGKFASGGGGGSTSEEIHEAVKSGAVQSITQILQGMKDNDTEEAWAKAEAEQQKQMAAHTGSKEASAAALDPSKFKSKKEIIGHLLQQEGGTTTEEILKSTGWPSVSVPQQAKALGLKLEKFKEGGVTKYKATPMTAAEKTEQVKAEAKKLEPVVAAAQVAQVAPPAKADVTKAIAEQALKDNPGMAAALKAKATPQELEKAKKNVALQLQYVPGNDAIQSAAGKGEAQKLVDEFNKKYSGQNLSTNGLEKKVQDFKLMTAHVATIAAVEKVKAAEWTKQQQAQASAKAAAQKAKEVAEAKANAEKNKGVMTDLGINEQEAEGFMALVQMLGGKQTEVVNAFKQYEQEAKSLGYPLSGFEAAMVKNYSDGGYAAVNKALRAGTMTGAQHVYVKMVNQAIKKMPLFSGALQRGTHLSAEQQQRYIAGNVVIEEALTSTSISSPFGGNTHFKIKAIGKRATHIKKLSHYKSEDEVLFAARTFFKVTKVEGTPGGKMVVHMEEMDD